MKQFTNFEISPQSMAIISVLSEKFGISAKDVVEKAIENYSKRHTDHPLLKFAGTIKEDEATEMLDAIYANRHSKKIPVTEN